LMVDKGYMLNAGCAVRTAIYNRLVRTAHPTDTHDVISAAVLFHTFMVI